MRHIFSCYFSIGRCTKYERLARVLRYTARQHCPDWETRIVRIAAPLTEATPNMSGRRGLATNTDKLAEWVNEVKCLPDGAELVLMDSDTMIIRSLDPLWDLDFDIAITRKVGATRLPINGGVCALRVNARSRAFMDEWLRVNNFHFDNPAEHQPWRDKYAGSNQAALGRMLEEGHPPVKLLELRCREWNACHGPTWHSAAEHARIVHVKSGLRRTIFHHRRASVEPRVVELAQRWRALEQQAIGAEVRGAGACARA